jgi:hypothetical protein
VEPDLPLSEGVCRRPPGDSSGCDGGRTPARVTKHLTYAKMAPVPDQSKLPDGERLAVDLLERVRLLDQLGMLPTSPVS